MMKRAYIRPAIRIIAVDTEHLLAPGSFNNGKDGSMDIKKDDGSTDPEERAKDHGLDLWEDDYE